MRHLLCVLTQSLYNSVMVVGVLTQSLYNSVMVVGGNSLLNGFCDRLNIDLSSKIPPVTYHTLGSCTGREMTGSTGVRRTPGSMEMCCWCVVRMETNVAGLPRRWKNSGGISAGMKTHFTAVQLSLHLQRQKRVRKQLPGSCLHDYEVMRQL